MPLKRSLDPLNTMLTTYTHLPTRPMLAHAHVCSTPTNNMQPKHKKYPHCEMSSNDTTQGRRLSRVFTPPPLTNDTPHNMTNDTC
nr:MAG TPA: hypothetical protein [Caudoviricetes sp.]